MKRKTAAATTLGAVAGIAVFHAIHYQLYCKNRTDPEKSHCAVCGHRRICQRGRHRIPMKGIILFGDIKRELAVRYGKETADKLWLNVEKEYDRLKTTYPDLKGEAEYAV